MRPDSLRYAVVGHPVAHSLSPRIQRAFAAQFGMAIDYTTLDVTAGSFVEAVAAFFATGGRGLNITVPHKRAALAVADACSAAAARAGVANVLAVDVDGGLIAHNTDGSGLLRDLEQRMARPLAASAVLLLGAGGAACGVAGPLLDAGIASLTVVNRSPAPAQRLVERLRDPRARAQPWAALPRLPRFDLLINATSAGVLGQRLLLPDGLVDSDSLACDLAYGEAARPFLRWGHGAGARTADGLGMLVETAAESFAIWHGRQPQTAPVLQMLRTENQPSA